LQIPPESLCMWVKSGRWCVCVRARVCGFWNRLFQLNV